MATNKSLRVKKALENSNVSFDKDGRLVATGQTSAPLAFYDTDVSRTKGIQTNMLSPH